MAIYDDDLFLVNRDGDSFHMSADEVQTNLDDDDLFWVQRDGTDYSVTGREIKELNPGGVEVVIESVALSENDDGNNDPRYTDQSFAATVNSNVKATEPIIYNMKAKSEGKLISKPQTSVITGFDDASKQLTFAGPENLTEYIPGTEIRQNSDGTPVSTEITNVDEYTFTTSGTSTSITQTNESEVRRAFDGNPDTVFGWTESFLDHEQKKYWSFNPAIPIPANTYVQFHSSGTGQGFAYVGGTRVNCPGGITTTSATTLSSIELETWTAQFQGRYCNVTKVTLNGAEMIWNKKLNTLTVADNTNLANFGKGDEVQPGVLITAVNEDARTIAVHDGSWLGTDGSGDVDGETFVTGPTIPAATGKVASTDLEANTITLSESTGRWLVTDRDYQEDLKLNKVVEPSDFIVVDDTELFAVFNDQGVITDMSDTDPGYRQMSGGTTTNESFNLQFPYLFSNGKTPDETLPEGATLCVDVKAQNGPDPNVFSEKTDTCITPIGEEPVPQSLMNGLRFDEARETMLSRELEFNDFTFSCWFKRTGEVKFIATRDSGIDQHAYIRLSGSTLRLQDNGFGASASIDWTVNVPENKWTSLVFSRSGDDYSAYINGALVSTQTKGGTPYLGRKLKYAVGAFFVNTTGAVEATNGYLSEVYFVDGQALPPETFGYDYENQGKWAPLEIAVIKQNITNAGGFGAGGFYLPFDPDAVGKNYSNNITTDGTYSSDGPPSAAFDGTTNTRCTTEGSDDYITVTFDPPLSGNIGVACSAGRTYKVNNSPVTPDDDSGNGAAFRNLGTFTSVDSVTVVGGGGGLAPAIHAIQVDGEILLDSNSIGVDDSGNENHFHDQNFALGNTVWSKYGDNTVLVSGRNYWTEVTFGSASGQTDNIPAGTSEWIITDPLKYIQFTKLEIEYRKNTAGVIKCNGNTLSGLPNTIASGRNKEDITSLVTSPLQSFSMVRDGGSSETSLFGIYVDGVPLIDANIQDTVTDTPVKNYATLLTGENGNLVATGDSSITYLGEAGTDYYYEEDGVGKVHTGGTTFTSVNGKPYNFGQQPFAAQYNDSEVWSDDTVSDVAIPYGSIANLYDGVVSSDLVNNGLGTGGEVVTLIFSPPLGDGSSDIQVYASLPNTSVMTINGTGIYDITNTPNRVWSGISEKSISTLKLSGAIEGAKASIWGIKVGGKILTDTGSPLAAAYGNNLLQTWEQWNNVATFFADNPAHVEKFNVIKEELEAYEGDKIEFRSKLVGRMASNFSPDEIEIVTNLFK
jgi:hypothetical protein